MNKSIALYPGTFDPPTNGHLDVIAVASQVFTELIVAVSASRQSTTFSAEQRQQMIEDACQQFTNIQVVRYNGLTVNLADQLKVTVIVRGIRSSVDYQHERNMAIANNNLAPNIPTLLVMPSPQFSHISSTLVKEIAGLDGDIKGLVPVNVAQQLFIINE